MSFFFVGILDDVKLNTEYVKKMKKKIVHFGVGRTKIATVTNKYFFLDASRELEMKREKKKTHRMLLAEQPVLRLSVFHFGNETKRRIKWVECELLI